MSSTAGFYKFDDNELFYAPNFVYGPNYQLILENKDTYQYPVNGWYFFDSEEEAKIWLGV